MVFKRYFVPFLLLASSLLLYRCAQVVPLTGGDKDTTPPKLISVSPANRSTNIPVKNVKIIFKFDEMVSVQNVQQKMIINPLTTEMPEVTALGKAVIVSFEKDLEPNTTYFLQLGSAVVDIHEGNAYPSLNYIFSTGAAIDTAYITGSATNALTKRPAKDVSVLLYRNLANIAIEAAKPDYITRTDEAGKYYLSAVRPGKYTVVAISDKNKNQAYDAGEELAFSDEEVEVDRDTVNFVMSKPVSDKVFIKKKLQPFWGLNRFVLNDTFPNVYMITEKSIDTDRYSYESRNDTLDVYYRELYSRRFEYVLKNGTSAFDTISIQVPEKSKVDSSLQRGLKKINGRAERAMYGAKRDEVFLIFSVPVKSLLAEKCVLLRDTVREIPRFSTENVNDAGNLVTTYLPTYKRRLLNDFAPQKKYTIVFLPGAIESFWDERNADTLKVSFKTFAEDETGSLQVKLNLPETIKSYVLQVMDAKEHVVREVAGANKREIAHGFYNLPAGEYFLRLIADDDQNAKFSPASWPGKKQPEKVFLNAKPVKIPAGWDVETAWMLSGEEKK